MWIESPRKFVSSAPAVAPGMWAAVLCLAVMLVAANQVCPGQTTIASKRSHGFYISLMSKSGELAEKDEYCAVFGRTKGGDPAHVDRVFVELEQQVGRIRESGQMAALSLDSLGRYCGTVDLGKQYYEPAFYYVTVHYADSLKKKRVCRFFLTLK
jgi:hypothetical protein